jgi:hypothetical protein
VLVAERAHKHQRIIAIMDEFELGTGLLVNFTQCGFQVILS